MIIYILNNIPKKKQNNMNNIGQEILFCLPYLSPFNFKLHTFFLYKLHKNEDSISFYIVDAYFLNKS